MRITYNKGKIKMYTITADGQKPTFEEHTFEIFKLKWYYFNNI